MKHSGSGIVIVGIVAVIVVVGVMAGILSFSPFAQPAGDGYHAPGWSPRNYVAKEGECFVPPQGDPLYDEKYKDINQGNCEALKTQSESKNIDAHTEKTKVEVSQEKVGFIGTIVFFITVVVLLIAVSVVMAIAGKKSSSGG